MFKNITFLIPLLLVMVPGIAHAAPGDLDTTFNPPNGFVIYDSGSRDYGNAVAIQSDGKLVVVGKSEDALVLRYNAEGSPDNSFGTNGVVIYGGGKYDQGNAMAIQSDGKIVIVGRTNVAAMDVDVLVLRYNTDGSLDNTFGTNGIVTFDYNQGSVDYGWAVAIQSDGKIVVVGAY